MSALAYTYAQFQQTPANLFSTPEPIVPGHLSDQGDRFRGDLRLVGGGLCSPLPLQAQELPMPPEQGIWLKEDEGLFPCPNEPCQQDEEHATGPGDR